MDLHAKLKMSNNIRDLDVAERKRQLWALYNKTKDRKYLVEIGEVARMQQALEASYKRKPIAQD